MLHGHQRHFSPKLCHCSRCAIGQRCVQHAASRFIGQQLRHCCACNWHGSLCLWQKTEGLSASGAGMKPRYRPQEAPCKKENQALTAPAS